jgi:flagellar biosynthesis regulator FlbT
MKTEQFSSEFLTRLRSVLPYGAQAEIARKLSTPDSPLGLKDVIKALHGKRLRYPKIDSSLIIQEAIEIYKAVTASRKGVKEAVDALSDDAIMQ